MKLNHAQRQEVADILEHASDADSYVHDLETVLFRLVGQRDALLETVQWISGQSNLFFAECSQAEEIIVRCQKAIAIVQGEGSTK